jgi:hypothetical protein
MSKGINATILGAMLLSGCAWNDGGTGDSYYQDPKTYKPLFGSRVDSGHSSILRKHLVVNGALNTTDEQSTLYKLQMKLVAQKALNKEKDRELTILREKVGRLSNQVERLVVYTQEQEFNKVSVNTCDSDTGFRLAKAPVKLDSDSSNVRQLVDRSPKKEDVNKLNDMRMIKASLNKVPLLPQRVKALVAQPVKKVAIPAKKIEPAVSKIVQVAKKIEVPTKLKVSAEVTTNEQKVKKSKRNPSDILKHFQMVGYDDPIGSKRHYLDKKKPSNGSEVIRVDYRNTIDVIAKFPSRKIRDHYLEVLKSNNFQDLFISRADEVNGWQIHLGRYKSYMKAYKQYKTADKLLKVGKVYLKRKKKSFKV